MTLDDEARPRLPRGVRLRHDSVRGEWHLLAPERVVQANGPAVEVLKRCDGATSLGAIVDDLATTFAADRALIDRDVRALLADLVAKRMVDV